MKYLIAGLLIISSVILDIQCQISDDDDDPCVCVDVWKCENGYVTDPSLISKQPSQNTNDNTGVGLIDKRIRTCEGIQICCPLPPNGQIPGGPVTPRPTPGGNTQTGVGNTPSLPQVVNLQGCGVRRYPAGQTGVDLNSRISGIAEDTFYGEAPWMARILVNGEFVCGGTIVNQQVVLTGAHCLSGKRASEVTVEAGEWNTASDKEPIAPQRLLAISLVLHPEFNDKNLQHNVALVFLRGTFRLSEVIDTICTPDSMNEVNPQSCVAVGWGKEDIGSKYPLQPIMRKVPMPIMGRDECQTQLRLTRLGTMFRLLPGFICGGGRTSGDTCKGDGGGPLYCAMKNEPNRLAVVGVTAWGIECGKGNPTVFASVPDHISWISQQLNDDKWYQG